MNRPLLCSAISLLTASLVRAGDGPYPPGPAQAGSDAIPAASPLFTGWATSVAAFLPGPRKAGAVSSPVSYGSLASALGPPDAAGSEYDMPPAEGPVLSLGDGGSITLAFSPPIADGEGPDFAVFENGFTVTATTLFAELAFVEVSSDGVNFTRFPAVSLTPVTTQTGAFNALDPRNLHNLAGKHPAGYGVPFDLAELAADHPGLNVNRVTHVRLVDVTGDVKTGLGSRDSLGNWINDPFPTDYQSGGFDLDAVGVIHQASDPWGAWLATYFDAAALADPAISGHAADPDGDGKSNLVEYACGFVPNAPEAASALEITPSGNGVLLRFHRHDGRADVILTLQESADGQAWTTLASSTGGQPVAGAVQDAAVNESGSPQVEVSITVPPAGTRRLYRLKITRS